jgi:hypothetical protein
LKLNADCMVLSASIAGDGPGAEALSGLARSFLYAGARPLMVALMGGLRVEIFNCASQHFLSDKAAADGRATTTPNQ